MKESVEEFKGRFFEIIDPWDYRLINLQFLYKNFPAL